MQLLLGGDTMVARDDIVAVLRPRIVRSSRINRAMMETARGGKEIVQLGGSRARPGVVTDDNCAYRWGAVLIVPVTLLLWTVHGIVSMLRGGSSWYSTACC